MQKASTTQPIWSLYYMLLTLAMEIKSNNVNNVDFYDDDDDDL